MKTVPSHALRELAETLWAERHVVEYLLFKMVSAKLVLAADQQRFVPAVLDEVEKVLVVLRDGEGHRERALDAVAAEWDVPRAVLTLDEVAARAPAPMDDVFRDHQRAFQELAEEIERTAVEARQLASSGLAQVQQTLDALAGTPSAATYNGTGRRDDAPSRAQRLDRAL